MRKIAEVFLDMDGVLCNFEEVYIAKFGIAPTEAQERRERKETDQMWHTFISDKEFTTLPMMDGAKELLTYLDSKNRPISILSSSGGGERHEEVLLQKYVWLDNHNITYSRIIVPGKRLKKEYAHEGALLIDDTPENVTDFRLAGGNAVLWAGDDKLKAVKLYFDIWDNLNN
jgi:hypothetical protein